MGAFNFESIVPIESAVYLSNHDHQISDYGFFQIWRYDDHVITGGERNLLEMLVRG